jgi:hypothetical protein
LISEPLVSAGPIRLSILQRAANRRRRASKEATPFEEPALELSCWRLAQFMDRAVFSQLRPGASNHGFITATSMGGKSLHEAVATGGAMILATGWRRDTLQLGIAGYTPQPLATRHDPGGTK